MKNYQVETQNVDRQYEWAFIGSAILTAAALLGCVLLNLVA